MQGFQFYVQVSGDRFARATREIKEDFEKVKSVLVTDLVNAMLANRLNIDGVTPSNTTKMTEAEKNKKNQARESLDACFGMICEGLGVNVAELKVQVGKVVETIKKAVAQKKAAPNKAIADDKGCEVFCLSQVVDGIIQAEKAMTSTSAWLWGVGAGLLGKGQKMPEPPATLYLLSAAAKSAANDSPGLARLIVDAETKYAKQIGSTTVFTQLQAFREKLPAPSAAVQPVPPAGAAAAAAAAPAAKT